MINIVDPSELTPAGLYRQACVVNSKTSRGRDRGWYQEPLDLACQWHLWFDGGREVRSAAYSRTDKKWWPGPALPLSTLTTGEGAAEFLQELLSAAHFGQRPKALGVIFHVADEFALAEVMQRDEGQGVGTADLGILHYNLIDDPCEVLVDREVSVGTTSWRLLPFWAAGPEQERCTAIALPRTREAFLQTLIELGSEWKIPVRAAVTSAPMETLAALPLLQSEAEGGKLVAIIYLRFTALFAISPGGELRSVRSLVHRGNLLVPNGFGDLVWNMTVSTELSALGRDAGAPPKVLLISDNPAALQAAKTDLETFSATRQRIQCECLDTSSLEATASIPGRRPEFMVYDRSLLEAARLENGVLSRAQTFRALWDEWLKKCNFFDTQKLDEVYPTLRDLQLLRASSIVIYLVVLGLVGTTAYGFYSLYEAMNHPSWSLSPMEVRRTEAMQMKLLEERKQIEVTGRLLQPRSRGWAAMEFLLQLFPEDSGVRVEAYSYNLEASRPVVSPANTALGGVTGMVRSWNIKGVANGTLLQLLNSLNSQKGLNELFNRVAKITGDPSYQPHPLRQLTATNHQGRNPKYNASAAATEIASAPAQSYPYTFEVTVTQTINDKDSLALPTEKPF